MKIYTKLLSILLGMALVILPTHTYAATSDEITNVLFEETTVLLEIEINDADLAQSLINDLEYALEEGIIDPGLTEEIKDAVEGEREPLLDELFDENLGEQEESWLEKSPELLNAFELVKFEFHQCRIQSTGGARGCAQGLGFKLQAASVQIALESLEVQKAALTGLEGAELEEALALITAQEEELAQKLARAQEKLDRINGKAGSTELKAAVSDAEEAGVSPQGNGNQGNGNQGNGNQGNGNQGNGNQGNGNQGNGNQGNGNQGNGNQGNGNQGNGNQGNGNQGKRGNG
jgi:hypothetical protein